MLPVGPLETPPPPPPPSAPVSPLPSAGPLPTMAPLAPVGTPDPRPLTGDEDAPEKSTDPSSGNDPARDPDGTRQLIDLAVGGSSEPPAPETSSPNAFARSLAQLASTAGEAVQRFAFPLSLTILVLVFLLIQGEIDRRDPKLAFAPVDSSKDMVYFQ
ncbi:MAG TPA: hypothetical protein VG318_17590 [Actinomycetota bacterium]|nr:hypothetical protein [Actinomycetota bacterium]